MDAGGAAAAAVRHVRAAAIAAPSPALLYRRILDRIPTTARYILIGEASHGTEEFYHHRAEITKLLIQERGFQAVIAEADFPDAFRANMYVRGLSKDRSAREALSDFTRFPLWMWRNSEVEAFLEWLRDYNAHHARRADSEPELRTPCGWYGMDVYSLHTSADAVVSFLERNGDTEAAKRARARYRCFDRFGRDAKSYGMATGLFGQSSCEEVALRQLRETAKAATRFLQRDGGPLGEEEVLMARANALVVVGAEQYYRQMYFGDEITWNLRDSHFKEVVDLVAEHVGGGGGSGRPGGNGKVVLWAHNSHLGDARASEMGWSRGEHNVGQLVRQAAAPGEAFSIGFTTHTGSVAAADEWDDPVRYKAVVPSLGGSLERLMHDVGLPLFAVDMRQEGPARDMLKATRLQRAIGVIYRPETERWSHYYDANAADQFDMIVHHDVTRAVHPLDGAERRPALTPEATHGDLPETYPTAV